MCVVHTAFKILFQCVQKLPRRAVFARKKGKKVSDESEQAESLARLGARYNMLEFLITRFIAHQSADEIAQFEGDLNEFIDSSGLMQEDFKASPVQ